MALSATGQDNISFEATTDARQVVMDGYFEVTFTLKNASGSQFVPPSFKDFAIVAGPSTSVSTSIFNGAASREMGFSYTLQPTKLGRLTIGSASIKVNGKTYRSNPISIDVVKGSPKAQNDAGEQFFIRVEPNKKQAYIGEQVSLDFKLYTRVNIDGFSVLENPDYDGFYAVELRRFSSNTVQEVVNGQTYTTKVLNRISLFPQQAGKLTVEPFRIQLAVVEEDGGRSGFFFNRNVKPVNYTTNSVEINVKPLPSGAAENFCGAVGSFELQAGIDRKSLTTDDAVTLTLILTGNGDIKRVQPPTLLLSDSFEVYEPKVVNEKSDEIRGEVVSEKQFEYLILPKYAGQYNLNPNISYFDTEQNQYSDFIIGPFPISVKKGTGKRTTASSNSEQSAMKDILPIKSTTRLSHEPIKFAGSILFYGLLLLPLLCLIWIWYSKKRKNEISEVDPIAIKIKSAGREAQKRLSTAQQQLLLGSSRGFYDEVSKAYIGYACDKTSTPLSQFSKELVSQELSKLQVSASTIEAFLKIVQTCEVALFAGMDNHSSMSTTYEHAIAIITKIEDELSNN